MQVIIEIYDMGASLSSADWKLSLSTRIQYDGLGVEKRTSADRFGFTGHVSVFPGGLTG